MIITIDPHPLLDARLLVTRFPSRLGGIPTPEWLAGLLALDAPGPLVRREDLRAAVRDMLRFGGYKPTGRGKPASEYLVRAASEGTLGPINPAVDVGNAVSLHSGLPISVVDFDRLVPPLRIGIAGAGASYVFNSAAHVIDLEGLLCLQDSLGECANGVKDSQRTKTNEETRATLTVIWGVKGFQDEIQSALNWYRELLESVGATVQQVEVQTAPVH